MVNRCELLGVRSFVLEVRSQSANHVPINLHQANVILCSNKKGQCHKAQLSPSEVLVLAQRRQSPASSTLSARSPNPVHLSSLREPGAYDPTGPQAPQTTGTMGAGLSDYDPSRQLLSLGRRDRDEGRFTVTPRSGPGQCVDLAWAPEPCRTQPPACSLGSQLT